MSLQRALASITGSVCHQLCRSIQTCSSAAGAAAGAATGPPGQKGQVAAGRRLGLAGVQHVIAVASGKGGVGKSTVAGVSPF